MGYLKDLSALYLNTIKSQVSFLRLGHSSSEHVKFIKISSNFFENFLTFSPKFFHRLSNFLKNFQNFPSWDIATPLTANNIF